MKAATEQQNAYLEKLSAKSGGKTKPKALKKKLDVLVKKKTALDSATPLLRCFAPLLCACLSVCLSVRPSVRPSVCLSVCAHVGGRGQGLVHLCCVFWFCQSTDGCTRAVII
jgi:hypothetical protein